MLDIKVEMGEIKDNQKFIIGEISAMEKNFAEVLRTLEKIAKSVQETDKVSSPAGFDGQPKKVTCYFTDFVILLILLFYLLC